MNIREALKYLKKGCTIKSEKIKYYDQDIDSLLYWLLDNNDLPSNIGYRIENLVKILNTDDWEVDGKPMVAKNKRKKNATSKSKKR